MLRTAFRLRAALLGLALAWSGAWCAEPPGQKTVLLLSSLPLDTMGFQKAINTALMAGSPTPLDIYNEYTALDRFSGPAFEASLLRLYQEKYGEKGKVDLIIVVGPSALEFLVEKRFLPEVPVVTCFVPKRFVEEAQRRRPEITGAVHPQNAPMTLDLMLSLFPRTKRIHIVLGASAYERNQAERARQMFARFAGRVELDAMNDLTLEQMEARLRDLPEEDLALYAMMTLDAAGHDFSRSKEPLIRLAKASRRPLFGVNTDDLGEGIVGGVLISQEAAAEASVAVGLKILQGQRASAIPLVQDIGAVPMFDWGQLKRWGIRQRDLPPGSVVEFRKVSVWDTHRREISGGIGLIILEGVLVAGLVIQLRRRRRTELALAKAEEGYRTVADFTHDWEFWQRPDGSYSYISPACERLSGYPPEAFRAEPGLLSDLVLDSDRPAWLAHQRAALAGEPLASIEFQIRTREGAVRWVDQANNPVQLAGTGLAGTRGSIRDITARKQADLDLQRAYGEIAALKDRLEAENTYYRDKIQAQEGSKELLGGSDSLKYLLYRIRQVAPSGTTVLIQGETGTGKELVAEAIHKLGTRQDRPLVKINCAALPPGLAESELFGHEKGAFTGAQALRKGRFEVADKATLFLDEVGELSPEVQAKLLRVLQDGEFQRVGGDRTFKVDVRVIAATNRDLSHEVAAGRFREDLWYRLNVFPITVPPLRGRQEDIPILAQSFVARFCHNLGRPALDLPKALIQKLQAYPWPGNVRELQNIMERAVLVSEGTSLRLADPLDVEWTPPATGPGQSLEEIERQHIIQTLEAAKGRIEGAGGAAERLGMKPSTLRNRMIKFKIGRT